MTHALGLGVVEGWMARTRFVAKTASIVLFNAKMITLGTGIGLESPEKQHDRYQHSDEGLK